MISKTTFKILLICLLGNFTLPIHTAFSQDTVRYYGHLNLETNDALKHAVTLYQQYIDAKETGEVDYTVFWNENEIAKYSVPDLASHYLLPKSHLAIMGLSKLDSSRYLLKTVGYMPTENEPSEIMYIHNYVVHYKDGKYRLGNYLNYVLENNAQRYTGEYGEYYGVTSDQGRQIDILLRKMEVFFESTFDVKFKVINFTNNLESLRSRGYDYFIGSLNSKTTVSGLYNPANNMMYTTSKEGIHTHEILRSLHTLLPESPIILRNGLANLIGGSLGISIHENIKLIYPYLKQNPSVFDNISSFYYYDDQVVPNAVFTALVTNAYLKKHGKDSLKALMKTEGEKSISIEEFLVKYLEVGEISEFFLQEMQEFLMNDSEFTRLF